MNLAEITNSSKINAIIDTLKKAKGNGRRKLVFAHYRGEIDILMERLKKEGITCQAVDGRTKAKERKFAIMKPPSSREFDSVCKTWLKTENYMFDKINAFLAPEVLIVQIQTACEGLNLQHFTDIYFTSPHWNPAVEDQAIARAHRIGQNTNVNVYKFTMKSLGPRSMSFEDYCCKIQDTKREIMKIVN